MENKITNETEDRKIPKTNPQENKQITDRETQHIQIDLTLPKEDTPSASQQPVTQPRRSERTNRGVPPLRFAYTVNHEPINEPIGYREMLETENINEKTQWKNATIEEYNSLMENKTWDLVHPPQGAKIIGNKWIYKAKYNEKGEVKRFKARLVAKGYLQKYGVDFDETYAPVVSYTTLRAFLTSAAYLKLNVNHIDVKTAFLHGELSENVYMSQPEGFIDENNPNKVCKLKKAIYGLKQAARAWNLKISDTLKALKFKQSTNDNCLFTNNENETPIFIIIYVDDILIAGNEKQIQNVIEHLKKQYVLEDLGKINNYLGINIKQTTDGFTLNQTTKIKDLARKFNLENSKPYSTPMEPGYLKSEGEENILPNNTNYRKAIGTLLYIATITRPDILNAVNILSRRNETPRNKDWEAVKRVIKYLNSTKNLNLIISNKSEPTLRSYADADWAGDKTDRKSTSGNLFLLGENPIQWITKKQSCVAQSSAEAEYISAAHAANETTWILKLLEDLNLHQELPIILYEDNQSCIKMIESDKYTQRTKHVDIKYHCIKHLSEIGTINLQYCPSKLMIADIFTKPAPKPDFLKNRDKLQLLPSDHLQV